MATYEVYNTTELDTRMGALSSNDVIRMHTGTYDPNYAATPVATGISIEAYGDGPVICDGTSVAPRSRAWTFVNNWNFSGIAFTNYSGMALLSGGGNNAFYANDLVFLNTAGGIKDPHSGFISRCQYSNLTSYAVQVHDVAGANVTIVNNDCYYHRGMHAFQIARSSRLLHSTVVDHQVSGRVPINIKNPSAGCLVYGVIVDSFNFNWGICINNSSLLAADPGAYAQYCWAYDAATSLHPMSGTGCLNKDPQLVSLTSDRHPDPAGVHLPGEEPWGYVPAIAGTPSTDVLGDTRYPISGKYTIGAYAVDLRPEYDVYTDFPDVWRCPMSATTGFSMGDYVQSNGASGHWVGRLCHVNAVSSYLDVDMILGSATLADTVTNSTGASETISAGYVAVPTQVQDPSVWPPAGLPALGEAFSGGASSGNLIAAPTDSDVRYPDPDLPLEADALTTLSIPAWGSYTSVMEVTGASSAGLTVGEEVWHLGTTNTSRLVAVGGAYVVLTGHTAPADGSSIRGMDSEVTVPVVRLWTRDEYCVPDMGSDRFFWLDEPLADSYLLRVHIEPAGNILAGDTYLRQQGTVLWQARIVSYNTVEDWALVYPEPGYPRSQPVRGETLNVLGSNPAHTVQVRTEDWALQWEPGTTDLENETVVLARTIETAPWPRFPNKTPQS